MKANKFTTHQRTLQKKFIKSFGNVKQKTLSYRANLYKHELNACSERLRYEKGKRARVSLNKQFSRDQKSVYRKLRGEDIVPDRVPQKHEVEEFWKSIWCQQGSYTENDAWLGELQSSYCKNANQSNYEISSVIIEEVISKLHNNKAPGPDLIVGYWYKMLNFHRQSLCKLYKLTFIGDADVPNWLATARTQLIPKSTETHLANNYRPIACENLMYKIYTGCLHVFLQDHCHRNEIVTDEQAGGKKGSWGCVEQLLINKVVQDEVTKYQRDLVCAWLDYKKAFDSVSHTWLLESLKLAKVPPTLLSAIASLMKNWATRLSLPSTNACLQTDIIEYKKGILQGDSLSVLLFILAVNPLSHLLRSRKGYTLGKPKERTKDITHLFFVDDLKLFAPNINSMKCMLDLITTFSRDIGMEFGQAKCAYAVVKRGKVVRSNEKLEINGLALSPLSENEGYKYLGLDETLAYDGPLNVARVTKEYLRRVRKIWSSELSAVNKTIAHNAFAIPVLTPTFGLLPWTIHELKKLDVETRKLLCATGNFHVNGDIDRLYIPRTDGGRGLKSAYSSYQVRIISLYHHLVKSDRRNPFLKEVIGNEREGLVLIAEKLMESFGMRYDPSVDPSSAGKVATRAIIERHKAAIRAKVMHGYLLGKMEEKPDIDIKASLSWSRKTRVTSHFEGFIHAVQEQEISTKFLVHKRLVESGKQPDFDNRCRLCKSKVEDISHIMAGCEKMAPTYYTPLRHDVVAKCIWNSIHREHCGGKDFHQLDTKNGEFINTYGNMEFWWNIPVKTCTRVKNNRPDMVMWDHTKKTCTVIEIACPLDVNVLGKEKEKELIYAPLLRNMQLLHPNYSFSFIPIIVGATGYVSHNLKEQLLRLGLQKKSVPRLISKMQEQSVSGTVKIVKTFLQFKLV
jgi:hypothetical protein